MFDRICEIRRRTQTITWEMVNAATNQTLSRTLLTGLTTWIVALILYAFGGATIHGFAFCLVLGVLVGTYSSIYVATALLVWLSRPAKTPSRASMVVVPPTDARPVRAARHSPQPRNQHKGGERRKKRAA